MTSALYNRYIPPPPQVLPDVFEQSTTSTPGGKKRKRAGTRENLPQTGVGSDRNHIHHVDGSSSHTAQTDDTTGTAGSITDGRATEPLSNVTAELDQRSKKVKIKKRRHREEVSAANPSVKTKNGSGDASGVTQVDINGLESSIEDHNEQIEGNETLEGEPHVGGIAVTKHNSIRSKLQRSHNLANATRTTDAGAESLLGVDKAETEVELHDLVPLPQPDPVRNPEPGPSFSALPPWLAKPIRVSTLDSRPLEELKLSSKVLSALQNKGYRTAFAVQTAVLPLLLQGPEQHLGDVCISAATGSGKTLAYMLPLIESLRSRNVIRLRAVIVVPTRELVAQAWEVCELCATGSGLKISTAVGHKSLKEEQELLMKKTQKYNKGCHGALQNEVCTEGVESFGPDTDLYNLENITKALPGHLVDYESNVDVLICTPGRLVDHMRRTKGFNLDHIQWLVIDEADRLLNESFQEWVETVMKALETTGSLDRRDIRQKLLSDMGIPQAHRSIRKVILSATMAKDVGSLSALKLYRPKLVVLETATATSELTHDIASTADVFDEGEATSLRENSDGYYLPPTLHESAVGVGDGGDKPLYLLELLKTHLNMYNDSLQAPEKGPRTLWSEGTSIVGDANLNLANHGSVGGPASLDVDQRSTSSSSSESSDTSCRSSLHVDLLAHSASRHGNSDYPTQGVLIFTNNNENASRLARLLSILHPPYSTTIRTLTKSTSTSSGRQVLSAFRTGKVSILIASDRASRGLDVQNLRCVINYDIPSSVTGYVHRVGRTARAGKEGSAWTLTAHNEARWFWNDIAKGRQIRRAPERKVERVKINVEGLGDEIKTAYAQALKMLGDEAKGKGKGKGKVDCR